jgi:hypothetical protein
MRHGSRWHSHCVDDVRHTDAYPLFNWIIRDWTFLSEWLTALCCKNKNTLIAIWYYVLSLGKKCGCTHLSMSLEAACCMFVALCMCMSVLVCLAHVSAYWDASAPFTLADAWILHPIRTLDHSRQCEGRRNRNAGTTHFGTCWLV